MTYTIRLMKCGRGGIGRRAALRSLWANPRGSSSLLGRTIPRFKYRGNPRGFSVNLVGGDTFGDTNV